MRWIRTTSIKPPEGRTIHIWQADFVEWSDRGKILESILSGDEIDRAGRFLRSGDRDRYVFAHGVLRTVLAACLGCEPASVSFGVGPCDKPFLKPLGADIRECHFNLSHSGDRVLVAVSPEDPVGVDLEMVSRRVEVESLSRRFFSPAEADHILALPEAGRQAAFIDTWVCKEAFIKAVGEGLTMPLDSFSVSFDQGATRLAKSPPRENPHLDRPWSILRFPVAPGYAGAVAAPVPSIRAAGFHLH